MRFLFLRLGWGKLEENTLVRPGMFIKRDVNSPYFPSAILQKF